MNLKVGLKLAFRGTIDCWAILSVFIDSEDLRWRNVVGHGLEALDHHAGLSVNLFCGYEHYQTAIEIWS